MAAVLLIASSLGFSGLQASRAGDGPSPGYQCSKSVVACGLKVTPSTESDVCGVVDLLGLSRLPDKAYNRVKFFFGTRLDNEVLFLGGGSAKMETVIS